MSQLKLQILLGAVDKMTAPLKSISGQSRLTAKDLLETKKTARELDKKLGEIEGFKKLGSQIGVLEHNLKDATTKFEEIKKSVKEQSSPNLALINEYNKAEKAVKELSKKHGEMKEKYDKSKVSLQSATIGTGSLTKTQEKLKTALDAANNKLKQQRENLDKVVEAQRKLATARASYEKTKTLQGKLAGYGAITMGAGTALGMAELKPVIEYARAETAVTDLKVSMMGAGGVVRKEFGEISELATKLGNKLPGTTADFQSMMSTLIQQGMSAKAIMGGLGEATAYLGVQLKIPYEQAALFAAKLQDATGTAEKDMMGLMDTIQRSFYLGVDHVQDL